MSNETIHPALLNVEHLGAIVRWENGDTIQQGRLEHVEHGYDLIGPDGIADHTYLPRTGTLFTIKGSDPVLVLTDDDRAALTIIKEA